MSARRLDSEDCRELGRMREVRCPCLREDAEVPGGLFLRLYERGVIYGDCLFRLKEESICGSHW